MELSKRQRWCIWTPYFGVGAVKIYRNISEPAELRILTAVGGGARVISVGHGAEKPGLVPVAGFSGKLEDQPHLQIQPHQSEPKFGLFLLRLTWTRRKAGDQVPPRRLVLVLSPPHTFRVFWTRSHEERPSGLRNASAIWPRTGSAYGLLNWAMAIVVLGKRSGGKVALWIPKIESRHKYFYFACQISITSQNNWASWFN